MTVPALHVLAQTFEAGIQPCLPLDPRVAAGGRVKLVTKAFCFQKGRE
jgi:hypothetical protein